MEYTITVEAPYALKLLAAIQPVVPGEHELALVLANRAFSLDIHVNEIRGMNREAMIRRILIGTDKA